MRVLLDANVLFSAAKSDGAVRALLQLLLERGHECWADAYVVAEARRNLHAKGPASLCVLEALLPHLRLAPAALHASAPAAHRAASAWLLDKDQPVLLAAIRLGSDVLVSGDRPHFGPGYSRAFEGVTINSPCSLAERVLR